MVVLSGTDSVNTIMKKISFRGKVEVIEVTKKAASSKWIQTVPECPY
jgi:hypothetical protein